MRKPITDTLLRGIKAPPNKRLEIADTRCAGLEFRVTPNGAKSWSFRFRDPSSAKVTRATIGNYPDISLGKARKRADALRARVAAGENPVATKRQERAEAASKTFKALADRFMKEHSQRHKRSWDADERNLRLHILPRWADRRFDSIGRQDAIALIEELVQAGTETLANRVHALISSIFSFAVDADLLKANPVARMRRRGAERVGRRVLSDAELRLFWSSIVRPPVSRQVGLALRLTLLTGARAGEVAGIVLTEFEHLDDLQRAAWILPANRSKNRKTHLVPLSPLAIETIRDAQGLVDETAKYLFPSHAVSGAPITGHALAVAMARFAASLTIQDAFAATWRSDAPTPHDLRRTVRTRMSELGISKEDRDAVLNHTPSDVGSKHYDLYDRSRPCGRI